MSVIVEDAVVEAPIVGEVVEAPVEEVVVPEVVDVVDEVPADTHATCLHYIDKMLLS